MATFPDIVGAPSGYQRLSTFRTSVSRFGKQAGNMPVDVAYRKWLRPRYTFSLSWDLLTPAQAREILKFLETLEGSQFAFDWFDWKPQYWINVHVAVGDGSTVTFDLPAKDSVDQQFYINGTTFVTGSVVNGAGADGRDRVTLSTPVPSGQILTFKMYGRRAFSVSFATEPTELVASPDRSTYAYAASLISDK